MNRLAEINARMAEIANEIESANEEQVAALEAEVESLTEERNKLIAAIEAKKALRSKVAEGLAPVSEVEPMATEPDANETRAKAFASTGKTAVNCAEARATLVSGGTLVTPTGVEGINDIPGAKYSSIIDFVKVENCEGMGANAVSLITADLSAAAAQTEGSTVDKADPTFAYVTIQPTSVLTLSQISKQAKKQSPLQYEAKVRAQALIALRKKAAAIVTTALQGSSLLATQSGTLTDAGKGKIDEKTLRNLALAYGGDESVIGEAVLFLNKADLIAFGDVRGTNEKKAIYEITPDSANPNTGTIKEGGLVVKYCLNSNLTAFDGTAQEASTGDDILTMFYGNPRCIELDLFSDYEIRVSEDFAFDKLLDTIRGDVELGADLVVKNGFIALKIPKAAAPAVG